MKKTNWLAITLIGIIALLALFWLGTMTGGWRYGGYGMMGWGDRGYGGHMGWGFSPFGWIGMTFMWLIPVGFLALTALGIVWLVRAITNPAAPSMQPPCPDCGRVLQADWQHCPYCGAKLK